MKRKRKSGQPRPYRRRSGLFIVKVQRPLASSEADPPALVYNQDRTLIEFFPFDQALREAMGGDLKQYWWAYLQAGILYLERIAPEQEW
jgi:hypothetical protein